MLMLPVLDLPILKTVVLWHPGVGLGTLAAVAADCPAGHWNGLQGGALRACGQAQGWSSFSQRPSPSCCQFSSPAQICRVSP